MKIMGGDSRTSPTDLETIKATSNHSIGSIGSGNGGNGIITGGPIYRLCAQQLKPPSGKMGITGLRGQILANAAELMLHKNADNIDRTGHHSLLVRRSEKGYKAVVLGQRRLRLEGPEGHSVAQALELLLELTAELLEEVAEVWEYERYEGEEVRVFDDGSRIAVKND